MGNYLLVGAGCLVVGFFAGFYVSNNINRNAGLSPAAAQTQPNSPMFNQQTQVASVKEPNGAMMPDVAETLDRAKTQPENFEAQMKAGDMYQQIQNFEKAAVYYDAAAVLKPSEYEKQVRLGNAFFDVKQFEKAQTFYQQALEKKSDDVNVRTDFATTFIEGATPNLERAIQELNAALNINPKHEVAIYYMALAHQRKGDAENAKKYLARLEQVNPTSPLIGRLRQVIK